MDKAVNVFTYFQISLFCLVCKLVSAKNLLDIVVQHWTTKGNNKANKDINWKLEDVVIEEQAIPRVSSWFHLVLG